MIGMGWLRLLAWTLVAAAIALETVVIAKCTFQRAVLGSLSVQMALGGG